MFVCAALLHHEELASHDECIIMALSFVLLILPTFDAVCQLCYSFLALYCPISLCTLWMFSYIELQVQELVH
jgi:hypothetical protein